MPAVDGCCSLCFRKPDLGPLGREVLLATTDAGIRRKARSIFRKTGYTLHVMSSLAEVEKLAKESDPQAEPPGWWPTVIIADWQLKDGTGSDLLTMARKNPRLDGVPFILLAETVSGAAWKRLSKALPVQPDDWLERSFHPLRLYAYAKIHIIRTAEARLWEATQE